MELFIVLMPSQVNQKADSNVIRILTDVRRLYEFTQTNWIMVINRNNECAQINSLVAKINLSSEINANTWAL